ncbi:MAG: hypothetical protein DI529_01190 [Chryseobacterium sp.]|nr:MAG: hypothetical protein DI529_01190 [Chryseobacterium sp.]
MRTVIYPILFLASSLLYAQNTAFQSNQNMNNGILRNGLYDGAKSGYDIEGSPFIYINYVKAEIQNGASNILIRYNAMKDEIEVKDGANVYVLPKDDKYNSIIIETGEKINLVSYTERNKTVKGYLFLIAEKNNIKLYRKDSVILTKEKEAKSSYEENRPAEYKKQKEVYFLEANNGKIIEFPKNKNKLIDALPDFKNTIEKSSFNYSKEADLVKFINSL